MALSAGKKMQSRDGRQYAHPVAALAQIYQGSLVMLKAGLAQVAAEQVDAPTAATCVVVGVAEKAVLGGATAGVVRAPVITGCWLFKNSSAGDLIALSNVGSPAYAVDDETVALTSDTNKRPQAGTIVDVESDGVWVRVGV
jgi:hypothetical protein